MYYSLNIYAKTTNANPVFAMRFLGVYLFNIIKPLKPTKSNVILERTQHNQVPDTDTIPVMTNNLLLSLLKVFTH